MGRLTHFQRSCRILIEQVVVAHKRLKLRNLPANRIDKIIACGVALAKFIDHGADHDQAIRRNGRVAEILRPQLAREFFHRVVQHDLVGQRTPV